MILRRLVARAFGLLGGVEMWKAMSTTPSSSPYVRTYLVRRLEPSRSTAPASPSASAPAHGLAGLLGRVSRPTARSTRPGPDPKGESHD